MRLRQALLLACVAALGLPAAAQEAKSPAPLAELGPAQMLAHRAAYRITLDRARDNSGVARAEGAMLFEVVDACDGWATRQRLQLTITDRDGQSIETTSDYSTYETKDGRRLRFSTTQMTQGAVSSRVNGEAELAADGSGTVTYAEPQGQVEQLPPGTLLPMRHTIVALNTARAGRRILVAPLFDGTSEDGAQDTTTVISAWQGPQPVPNLPALSSLGSARMRIAFFERGANPGGGGASAPNYEVGMRYFENGVADELKMDFGEFAVDAQLVEMQPVPGGC